MQNGFVESFNGRLRGECLNEHIFTRYRNARHIINRDWFLAYVKQLLGAVLKLGDFAIMDNLTK